MKENAPYFTDMDLSADVYAKRLILGKICENCRNCSVSSHWSKWTQQTMHSYSCELDKRKSRGQSVSREDTCHHWKQR